MNTPARKPGTFTTAATLTLLGLLLAGCASNKDRPNRQVAVYERVNRVVYVPVSRYRCYEGRLAVVAGADNPVAEGEATATLVGNRCYYADRYGRPLDPTIAIDGGVGVGIGGRGGIGGGVGVGVGRGGGSVNIGVGTRR